MIDLNRVIETYNVLSKQVKNDLNEQFLSNRIKGTDYGQAYSQLMSVVLQLAMQSPLDDANYCKTKTETEHIARQTAQIDDDVSVTILKVMMDAWSEAYKAGRIKTVPDIINNDQITVLYNNEINKIKNGAWRNTTIKCYSETETTQGIK